MKRTIYFGPPGTGKTTKLLSIMSNEVAAGVTPSRIAFLTFTRRARHEAVSRLAEAGYDTKDLPYFRTIHSMAFRALSLREGDVLNREHLDQFAEQLGVAFGDVSLSEAAAEGVASGNKGDVLLALDNLARMRGEPLRKTWADARTNIDWTTVDHFARSYATFKKTLGVLDFTDVLSEFIKADIHLPIEVAIIDEAQDLSALQWYAALKAAAHAERQYVAGDDDQAIYKWAGADVSVFINLEGERVVLAQSHRLPRKVHAAAATILKGIKTRVPKEFAPRDEEGSVMRHASVAGLPLDGRPWLWLVRNRYTISDLQEHLKTQGVVYSIHGRSSVLTSEQEAIYTWERLMAGREVSGAEARAVYKYLMSRTQVARGFKTLPAVADTELVTFDALTSRGGLLVTKRPWFEVLNIADVRKHYYRRLLRMHRTLKVAPTVALETIHGAKGAEADNVALFLDQSRRTYEEAMLAPDDEHRVWYVGATRARNALHVVSSQGRYAYAWR